MDICECINKQECINKIQGKYQYKPNKTIKLSKEDFEDQGNTRVYWLTGAGVFINSHGINIMVDPIIYYINSIPPVSETLYTMVAIPPILAKDVPKMDAVFYTHVDFDHMGKLSAQGLRKTGAKYYGTKLSNQFLRYYGIPAKQRNICKIGETFSLGEIEIEVTPAKHDYQKEQPEFYDWCFGPEDCCGFKIKTMDGTIWIPGDTNLLQEHLSYDDIDLAFIDFSACSSHFGREDSIKLFNHYKKTPMIMYHYGTDYDPEEPAFAADPEDVLPYLNNVNRLKVLVPGEKYILKREDTL